MRFSVNPATTMPYTMAQEVPAYAAVGIRHMELWLDKVDAHVSEHGLDGVRALLADHGIAPVAACAAGGVILHDVRSRTDALEDFRRRLEFCRTLACPILVTVPDFPDQGEPGMYGAAERNLRVAGEVAADHGVRLAVEFLQGLRELDAGVTARAREAVERYVRFLREELLGRSDGSFVLGREGYDFHLRNDHFLSFGVEELERIGRREFERTKAMLAELDARWPETLERMKREHPAAGELVETYRREVARARRFVVERGIVGIPDWERLEVAETPAFLRSAIPYAAYSRPGPLDRSRVGHFYVTLVPEGDPPEDKAKILGEQLLAVIHDKHALAVQSDAVLAIRMKQIKGRMRRNIEQRTVFGRAFELEMNMRQRIIPVVAQMFVKFFILLFFDLILGFCPDCLHGIERFFFFFIFTHNIHHNRICHKIRMFSDDIADHPFLAEILFAFFERFESEQNRSSAGFF